MSALVRCDLMTAAHRACAPTTPWTNFEQSHPKLNLPEQTSANYHYRVSPTPPARLNGPAALYAECG